MKTSELDYDLPAELIAQTPLRERDGSRLLVYERTTGALRHRIFRDLPGELPGGALVVVNLSGRGDKDVTEVMRLSQENV